MNCNSVLLGYILASLAGVWGCGVTGPAGMALGQLAMAGTGVGTSLVVSKMMTPFMPAYAQAQPTAQKVVTNNCEIKPDGTRGVCTESSTVVTTMPQSAVNSPLAAASSSSTASQDASTADPCTDAFNNIFYKGCWGK